MAEVSKVAPPLSQATGYGLILGLGAAFAVGMIATTWALKRYHGEVQTSEAFSTANRTVKSGLVASAVVSSCEYPFVCTVVTSYTIRDLGSNSSTILRRGIPIWNQRPILVRLRGDCSDHSIRNTSNRTKEEST